MKPDPPNLNWPHQGDKAFALIGTPSDLGLVAAFVLSSAGGYAVGFKDAADKVVEAAERDARNPDILFFPVAFLYRHSLELSLKHIMRTSARSGAISVPERILEEILGGHHLYCLWRHTRAAIEAVWPEGNRTDIDTVEKIILEFHCLDKSGQAFRYPTDKAGKSYLSNAPRCVSLQQMKKVVDGVDRYLDACYAGIASCDPTSP